jgi:hypothetical protein
MTYMIHSLIILSWKTVLQEPLSCEQRHRKLLSQLPIQWCFARHQPWNMEISFLSGAEGRLAYCPEWKRQRLLEQSSGIFTCSPLLRHGVASSLLSCDANSPCAQHPPEPHLHLRQKATIFISYSYCNKYQKNLGLGKRQRLAAHNRNSLHCMKQTLSLLKYGCSQAQKTKSHMFSLICGIQT